jgi:hypothetical protein
MRPVLITLIGLLCRACAVDCGGDPYALGQRDGRLGAQLQSQPQIYSARCSAPIDQARYAEGLSEGLRARPIPLW